MLHSDQTLTRFMGIDIVVPPGVLYPRAETELLAMKALACIDGLPGNRTTLVDMCCGSGNLAIALAVRSPNCRVWAADLSEAATAVANANAEHNGVASRVSVRKGDLFEALADDDLLGRVDIVVCNPPYISTGKLDGASAVLLEREPREAFDGGPFGISIHQRVIREALPYLRDDGVLLCEFGEGQARQIDALFKRARGYAPVEFVFDARGVERVAFARRLPRSDVDEKARSA